MYPIRGETPNNILTMTFHLTTSPTQRMVEWGPNKKPLFLPIPPEGGSVPTTLEDEHMHSFKFENPITITFNYSTIQQGTLHFSDDSNTDYGIPNEELAKACQNNNFQKKLQTIDNQRDSEV